MSDALLSFDELARIGIAERLPALVVDDKDLSHAPGHGVALSGETALVDISPAYLNTFENSRFGRCRLHLNALNNEMLSASGEIYP